VDVIGHPEGRYVGSGTLTERPFGAAVSRKGLALVTRLDAASVAVVDIATRQAVGTIPLGYSPTGVTFDREGNFAYVTNQHSQSIGVIDVAAREQVDEVAIGGDPFVVRVSTDGRKLFVSSNTSFVHIVDLQGRAVVDSVGVGYAPNGLAVDPSETKLYVSSFVAGTVAEVDIASSQVLRQFQVGRTSAGSHRVG
jgi:YVTN family beta-propeller protein